RTDDRVRGRLERWLRDGDHVGAASTFGHKPPRLVLRWQACKAYIGAAGIGGKVGRLAVTTSRKKSVTLPRPRRAGARHAARRSSRQWLWERTVCRPAVAPRLHCSHDPPSMEAALLSLRHCQSDGAALTDHVHGRLDRSLDVSIAIEPDVQPSRQDGG